ncbi:MAG: UbiX family flavin prenyltransferase [Rhizobiales bacterium]|nr:UbiX family flavin prenyltransferase [Hyphomicrobiales bacterium]OJU30362.1 MAG: hypothetical protein BGN94_09840 [Rhizobiales bacterium 68-8]
MTADMRLVVGISGASGAIYGVRLLELLRTLDVEAHLVMSRTAQITIAHELGMKPGEVRALAAACYDNEDVAAPIASGSFRTRGMIVAPCSMRSLAEIANGVAASLLTRAADVALKERSKLVLMARETPLHLGHLRNMVAATEMGAIICPPVPAFYARPQTIDELVDHTLVRVLDLFGFDAKPIRRWEGVGKPRPASRQ